MTPLHLAASSGHIEYCEALIFKGAEVNSTNYSDDTPLPVAARHSGT